MERCWKMDILKEACQVLTTLKKSIFSKDAGPGLQSVATNVDKINVTFLQSPLFPHSMLINECLKQWEAEFSAKVPAATNLQHWIGGKGGNKSMKNGFFGVTLGFAKDWSFLTNIYKNFFNNCIICRTK